MLSRTFFVDPPSVEHELTHVGCSGMMMMIKLLFRDDYSSTNLDSTGTKIYNILKFLFYLVIEV